jgi:two-component system, NtrC family, response regulator AtoC
MSTDFGHGTVTPSGGVGKDGRPPSEPPVLLVGCGRLLERQLGAHLGAHGYRSVAVSSLEETPEALGQSFALTIVDAGDGTDPGRAAVLRHSFEARELRAGSIVALTSEDGRARPDFDWVDRVLPRPATLEAVEELVVEVLRRCRARETDDDALSKRLLEEILLWQSPAMQEVRQTIEQAAMVDVTVLICGETGTGKDLVARAIHHMSARRGQPFVKVNCAAVPRDLLESELFGHERGAFTGAHRLRIGKFESANDGTVFLDEIGDLDLGLQAKLLHILQDGSFSRVGGRSTIKMDVRVLAATNQDLEQAVAQRRFREDLYYRLNVVKLSVPPLRERKEEVPLLVDYFVRRYSRLFRREEFVLSAAAREGLERHHYAGNVRELENLVKRMIVLNDTRLVGISLGLSGISREGLAARCGPGAPSLSSTKSLKEIGREAAKEAERHAIARVLSETGWNRARAAKRLRISYRALLYKIKDAGLSPGHSGG